MRSNQRKEVHMIADLLLRSEPTLGDVALGAIRAKLPQMNIGMAIGTILANIRKDRLGVTLRARELFVSAAKGKFCSIVLELRFGANRAPASSRMAIFARNQQRTVWVRSCSLLTKKNCWMAQKQKRPA